MIFLPLSLLSRLLLNLSMPLKSAKPVAKSQLHSKPQPTWAGCEREYLTLPHIFQAEPSRIWMESKWNGRNGWNLVGMTCQWEPTQVWLRLGIIPIIFRPFWAEWLRSTRILVLVGSYQIPSTIFSSIFIIYYFILNILSYLILSQEKITPLGFEPKPRNIKQQ